MNTDEPMRVLLDTHAFLWYITDDDQLSERAEAVISDGGNEVLLSVGSLWEITIKHGLGKLALKEPFGELMPRQLAVNETSAHFLSPSRTSPCMPGCRCITGIRSTVSSLRRHSPKSSRS